MNPYKRAYFYFALTIVGVIFVFYSIMLRNHVLLAIAILFSIVSADNIFCGFKDNKPKKSSKRNI